MLYSDIVPLTYVTEKAMATHSSTLAWKIPWTDTEEAGGCTLVILCRRTVLGRGNSLCKGLETGCAGSF